MRVAIVTMAMAAFVCSGFAATTIEVEVDVRGTVRTVVIELNETGAPKTCANFEKLCSQGFYQGIAFHRVIPNYIVQVGDPLSKDPSKKALWGTGGPGYTVPPEVGEPHLRGSVAMARIPGPTNPNKESSGSQFYFVLRDIPDLDGEYTVFGKVVSGLEAIEEIADLPKDANFNPIDRIEILSTKVHRAGSGAGSVPAPGATTSVLPPMPDLDAAGQAKEAEKAIPPPVLPPASAVAAVDPSAVPEPAPAETPVATPDKGLPPMPKLFTESTTPPPAPAPVPVPLPAADSGARPVPKPVEMPSAPAPDPGLPPMPKLATEDTIPPPLTVSPVPDPDPVAIARPASVPKIERIEKPSHTEFAPRGADVEEGAITIAEIGTSTPAKTAPPSYRAPEPARAPRPKPDPSPASAPAPPTAPADPAADPAVDPNAPPIAEFPVETPDPPKRGFLRGILRRIW